METLAAVLIYLSLATPGCQCYTSDDVLVIESQNQERVDAVYANEEEKNYAVEVFGPQLDDFWIPDHEEIAR